MLCAALNWRYRQGMIPRLYCKDNLSAGASVTLPPSQSHYLTTVLRRTVGSAVLVFNEENGEFRGALDSIRKGAAVVLCQDFVRSAEPGADIWLLFAPIKRTPADLMAQKATELGVRLLQPIFTQHTIVNRVNLERLRANALEAAEQCDRLDIPAILPPETLEKRLVSWPEDRWLVVADETGAGVPMADLPARYGAERTAPWALLIGPEGGFHGDELKMLAAHPKVIRVSLGKRVLRADTAALAALAVWQAVLGDWRA